MQPAASWPQWPFDIACYTLLAIGVPLLIWAWWWDRPRGCHRCPKCWYNLAGLEIPADRTQPPLKCPECGREVRSTREATRTRRRPWWAALALLMLAASTILPRVPRASREGWLAAVPTTVLVIYNQLTGPEQWTNSEDDERLISYELLHRATETSDEWAWHQRWIVRSIARQLVLIRSPAPIAVPIPVTWLVASVHPTPKLPTPDEPGMDRPSHEAAWIDLTNRIPAQNAGWFELPCRAHMLDGSRYDFAIPYEVRGTVNDCIVPRSDAALDRSVRAALAPRLLVYVSTGSLVIDLLTDDEHVSIVNRSTTPMTLALRITALRDGQSMAHAPWMRRTTSDPAHASSPQNPALLRGTPEALAALRTAIDSNDPAERARWTFTFTGDGELALSDVHSDAYWAGSFTMTLDELLAPRSAQTPVSTLSNQKPDK